VAGTPYEYTESSKMYGNIEFFAIVPENTSKEKNITINYLGKSYYSSMIKFAPNNGSWRIQLKRTPDNNTNELSKFGNLVDFPIKF